MHQAQRVAQKERQTHFGLWTLIFTSNAKTFDLTLNLRSSLQHSLWGPIYLWCSHAPHRRTCLCLNCTVNSFWLQDQGRRGCVFSKIGTLLTHTQGLVGHLFKFAYVLTGHDISKFTWNTNWLTVHVCIICSKLYLFASGWWFQTLFIFHILGRIIPTHQPANGS